MSNCNCEECQHMAETHGAEGPQPTRAQLAPSQDRSAWPTTYRALREVIRNEALEEAARLMDDRAHDIRRPPITDPGTAAAMITWDRAATLIRDLKTEE